MMEGGQSTLKEHPHGCDEHAVQRDPRLWIIRTFLLQVDMANHCFTVQPRIKMISICCCFLILGIRRLHKFISVSVNVVMVCISFESYLLRKLLGQLLSLNELVESALVTFNININPALLWKSVKFARKHQWTNSIMKNKENSRQILGESSGEVESRVRL